MPWPAMGLDAVHERLCAPGAEFEMEMVETPGGQVRAYRRAPASLRAVFEASWRWRDRTCVVFEDEHHTYAAHNRAVVAFARVLAERYGVRPGERVVIAMRNWPEWSVAFWAVVAIGAIAVPLNAWGAAAELRAWIRDCEPSVLVLDRERFDRLGAPEVRGFAVRGIVVVRGDATGVGVEPFAALIGSPTGARTLGGGAFGGDALPPVSIAPDDAATILYTSGTAGAPKGALATHRNIVANVFSRRFNAARAALRRGGPPPPGIEASPPSTLLAPVPLFHVTGCHTYLVPVIATGGTLVLLYRWSPERALALIERERIGAMGGVPTMLVQLLDSPAFDRHDLSSLRALTCGGAPSGASLVERIHAALPGVHTGNGYGMTETCSLVTQNTAEDHRNRPDSIGRAVPVCDLRVADGDGNEVAPGEEGELWVRGANVVAGYWNDPAATRASFVDGWLKTGDVVRMDDAGFVYLVDRLKDVVIRGGENVYCAEVEDALLAHPGVIESAVIGLPHDELGEIVAACVQRRAGAQVETQALRASVAERLAAFKIPEFIEVRENALPRNAAGKVIKRTLREEMMARYAKEKP